MWPDTTKLFAQLKERKKKNDEWKERRPELFARDYHIGREVELYPCTPLPLTKDLYAPQNWNSDDLKTHIADIGYLKWCLDNNPAVPNDQSPVKAITLTKKLKGDICSSDAHVWLANSPSDGKELVAKFFDPLYCGGGTSEPCLRTEKSLSLEYWCYDRLKDHWGMLVPEFHGAFLARLPLQIDTSSDDLFPRNVFVILLQYLPGEDLQTVDANKLTPATRETIWTTSLELTMFLRSLGVYQTDIAPRNFILRNPTEVEHSPPFISMVDFQMAEPYEKPWFDWDDSEEGRAKRMEIYEEAKEAPGLGPITWRVDGWLQ